MPLRVALTLFGLFALCLIVVLLAWANGSEFYLFFPSRFMHAAARPPTHPGVVLGCLVFCGTFCLYSPHYALVCLTVLLGTLFLGTIVGYGVFAWKPTLSQWALTLAMIAATTYGWSVDGNYLDY